MSQGTTLYPATYYPGCSTTMEYLLYEFVSCSTIVACVTTMSLPVDRVLSVSFLYHVISSVDLPLARAWSAKWDAVLFVLTGPIFGYHVTTNKLPKYIRCDIHPEVSFIVYCALIPTIVSILDGCQQPSPWTTTSATRSWLLTCTSYGVKQQVRLHKRNHLLLYCRHYWDYCFILPGIRQTTFPCSRHLQGCRSQESWQL